MKFKSLPGLPAFGDLPIQFSASGIGTHSEGFVVEFLPREGKAWIGNFQRGLTSFDKAIQHPDGKSVIVVAGGECYVVDPNSRPVTDCFGGDFLSVWELPDMDLVMLGGPTDFEALNSSGRAWRSKRISLDGFRNLSVEGIKLNGEAWSYEDVWLPFTLDITTGTHTGGPDAF